MQNSKTILIAVVDGPVFPGSEIKVLSPDKNEQAVLFFGGTEVLNRDMQYLKSDKDLMDRFLIPEMWPIAKALLQSR